MNKENAIQKINKTGNIGRIISIVFNVFLGVLTALCLIAGIVLTVLPENFISLSVSTDTVTAVDISSFVDSLSDAQKETAREEIIKNVNSGSASANGVTADVSADLSDDFVLSVSAESGSYMMNTRNISLYCFLGAFVLALAFTSTFFAGRLCNAFKHCESPFDSDVIKKLRYFAFSLIPWTFSASFANFSTGAKTGIRAVNINFNISMIFATLAVLGLSYIFKYGSVLQQESDETL